MTRKSSQKLKSALSGLRQFLSTESPLKVIKNVFYFPSKALFILEIFKFLSWLFSLVAKRLDKKDKVIFKFYDVKTWLKNNRTTHIAQYFKKQSQSDNEMWSVNRMNLRNIFLEKSHTKCDGETSPKPVSENLKLGISLRFYPVCFYCMPSWELLKHIETKLQTTFFDLKLSFFKK